MIDQHREDIWKRESAWQIMKEARKRFNLYKGNVEPFDSPSHDDHVMLASAHYSLVKRYVSPKWKTPLAIWHMRRAVVHADAAFDMVHMFSRLSVDQIDVITTIWRKAPWWLGGSLDYAKNGIQVALDDRHPEALAMKPHTRALLLIGLGEVKMTMGRSVKEVEKYYNEVLDMELDIHDDRQRCRVVSAAGFFFIDHPELEYEEFGRKNLARALRIARRVSKDQEEKILAESKKRGISEQSLLELSGEYFSLDGRE